jgi:RNA polymerase sigma-32 factor
MTHPDSAAEDETARPRGRRGDGAEDDRPDEGRDDEGEKGGGATPEDETAELVGEGLDEKGEWLVALKGGGALVRRDPLSVYLAEINRYERLTAEEEHALAVRWYEDRDPEAAARLVVSHLGLVVAVAMSFRRAIANVLDLIQEGNLGLLEAVQRFEPGHGARLSTYATWWIRSRIVKYLLDNWRLVRVGTTNARRKLLYNLRREKALLESQGVVPSPKLLAARLGTSTADVVAVDCALGATDVSLDAPLGPEGGATRGDVVPAQGDATPETLATEADMRERLHQVLAELDGSLSPRERSLLHERLMADDPVTLQSLADREGVTCEAVRQSEKRLLQRLRAHLLDRLPEAADFEFHARD